MVTAIPAARLAVIAYICVLGSCSCSNGTVQGILGESVSLSCMSTTCGSLHWTNDSLGETSPFITATKRTTVNMDGDSYRLDIFDMSAYDVGSYSCWCNENDDAARYICSDSLKLICQARVVVNNASKLYSTSRTNSFPEITINATVKDKLKVKCPEGAVLGTNCYNVMKGASAPFTYNFKVSWRHNSCRITCQAKGKVVCSISFTINVSRNETSTHNPTISTADLTVFPPVNDVASTTSSSENITRKQADTTIEVDEQTNKSKSLDPSTNQPASFSVMIVVGILIFVVVVFIFVVGCYIFSSRFKFSSQPTKICIPRHSSTDANIPIGPTYATANKSSNGFLKGDDRMKEPEVLSADGFYSEVGGAGQEESTTDQPISWKAETSITNDYYSEVNTSDVKLKTMGNGQETDSALYTEVNKGEKQTRLRECTSSQKSCGDEPNDSDVPIYNVLEESKTFDHDTV